MEPFLDDELLWLRWRWRLRWWRRRLLWDEPRPRRLELELELEDLLDLPPNMTASKGATYNEMIDSKKQRLLTSNEIEYQVLGVTGMHKSKAQGTHTHGSRVIENLPQVLQSRRGLVQNKYLSERMI